MEKTESTTDPSGFINEVLDQFRKRFTPCQDITEATHFYSTSDIHHAIISLNPGSTVSKEQLYEMLKAEGYTWQIDDSRFTFDLKWLLRQI